MGQISLPGGHTAVLALRMADFRELWASGAIRKIQGLSAEGGDLGDAYPILAVAVRSWDLVGGDGKPLDPTKPANYDELEPATFMRLLRAFAEYIAGEDSKN